MSSLGRITERFPITIGVLFFWAFAILTLPFIGLSIDSTPILSAKSQVLLGMFLTGGFLLLAISVVFTKGLKLIIPERLLQRYTLGQALVVIGGFLLVSIDLALVNQAFLGQSLASYRTGSTIITPGPTTSFTFKIDAAIAEESLFGALTIGLYLLLVYVGRIDRLVSAGMTLPAIAIVFTIFHLFVDQTVPQALWFVFGLRLVLGGVLLGTLVYSRRISNKIRSASLAALYIIHTTWNGLS